MYFKQDLNSCNKIFYLCIMLILCFISANIYAQQANQPTISSPSNKILIVYFSRTGNTEQIAKQIHSLVGGDIVQVQPKTPYPEDYNATTTQAKKEKEVKYNPPIEANINNLQAYDVIFVGYPVWWRSIPPPIRTFLVDNDLAGKIIIPFCTHAGSGKAQSINDIKELAPNALLLQELVMEGVKTTTAQTEVTRWLTELGMLNRNIYRR